MIVPSGSSRGWLQSEAVGPETATGSGMYFERDHPVEDTWRGVASVSPLGGVFEYWTIRI